MAKNTKNKKRMPPEKVDEAGNIKKRKNSAFDWDGDSGGDEWPSDAMIADVIGNGRQSSDDGCGFPLESDDIF